MRIGDFEQKETTGSSGRMVATKVRCSFVRSIHNYLYTNG
jgi:hypothetical protein